MQCLSGTTPHTSPAPTHLPLPLLHCLHTRPEEEQRTRQNSDKLCLCTRVKPSRDASVPSKGLAKQTASILADPVCSALIPWSMKTKKTILPAKRAQARALGSEPKRTMVDNNWESKYMQGRCKYTQDTHNIWAEGQLQIGWQTNATKSINASADPENQLKKGGICHTYSQRTSASKNR